MNWLDVVNCLAMQCKDYCGVCREYQNLMKKKHNENDPRAHFFGAAHNKAMMAYELFDHYQKFYYDQLKSASNDPPKEREAAGRCIETTKLLFIGVISLIEYDTRQTIRLYPTHKLSNYIDRKEKLIESFDQIYRQIDEQRQGDWREFRKQVRDVPSFDSFGRIMEASQKVGIIDEEMGEIWACIIHIRNWAVHNNTIPQCDLQINIDGREFGFREDEEIKGPISIDFYLFFTRKATDLFLSWAEGIN